MDLEELQKLIKEVPQKVQEGIKKVMEASNKEEGHPAGKVSGKSVADEL